MHVRNVLPTDLVLGPLQQITTQLGCALPKTTKVHCLQVCRPGVQKQGLGRADGPPQRLLPVSSSLWRLKHSLACRCIALVCFPSMWPSCVPVSSLPSSFLWSGHSLLDLGPTRNPR